MKDKKKQKRKVKVFLIVLLIIIIIIIALFIIKNNKSKSLAGDKIIDGLYLYKFNNDRSVQNTIVKDNKIYYLVEDNSQYIYLSLDIYTNKIEEIKTFHDDMCLLKDYFMTCSSGQKIKIYDNHLKEIYKIEEQINIIPYQDSILVVKDKDLYLNDNKIRTIKDNIERFDIIDYYVSDTNTYVYFVSSNDSYIYNIKDDSYEKFNYENMYFYEDGIYYANEDKIFVKYLGNGEIREYKNFKNDDDFSLSVMKDNLLFFMDNKYLKIYNLDTNKFKVLDYKFADAIDKMVLKNNYLYMINNKEIYVVNTNEIDSKEYTNEEYINAQKNKVDQRAKEIENKYSAVEIVYDTKDIVDYDKWEEKLINEDRYDKLLEALDAVDIVLDKFGEKFISLFKHDDYKGLRIIIMKEILNSETSSVKNSSGLTFPDYTNYNVIISEDDMPDVMPYEKLFCHEMMHAIDYHALSHKYDVASNWYDYNPKGFVYDVKYYQNDDNNYTSYEYDENNVYFVDSYSKLNQSEDRARIFENVCYIDEYNVVNKYPNLLKKAKYIRDVLIQYYPDLKDSKIFDGIE